MSDLSVVDVTRRGASARYRELLTFSVPLAASGAIGVIAKHSDLIILGVFKSSSQVGVYEVSFRIAMFVVVLFTPALGYLFEPIVSRFDAAGDYQRMDDLYTVATRWLVVATFPVFALFFLFPAQTLGFFFGESYQAGRTALRILLMGFLLSLLPGLTSGFLTAVGETKVLLYLSAGTMLLNVVVNVALIPLYGLVGAAIATAAAQALNNAAQSYYIYRDYTVNPFVSSYVGPTALMLGVLCSLVLAPIPFDSLGFLQGIPVAASLGLLFLVVLLLTRSVYAVELELIDGLLERAGVPISVSRHLQPFVR